MPVPPIEAQAGKPTSAFAVPLRALPRRPRLLFLIGFRIVSGFVQHQGPSWSAAIAFWLVLSLPPLLIAMSSLAIVLLGAERGQELLAEQVTALVPAEGQVIEALVEQTVDLAGPAGLVAIGFLLFSGSRVFDSLITAINVIWRHVDLDGFVRRQVVRVAMMIAVGGLFLVGALLQLGVLAAADDVGLPHTLLVRLAIPTVLVFAGLALTYRFIPAEGPTWTTALFAAALVAILLRVTQALFTLALGPLMEFETAYGPLAGIAILMTWAVTACTILLLGAELVATLDRHRLAHVPLPTSKEGDAAEHSGARGR